MATAKPRAKTLRGEGGDRLTTEAKLAGILAELAARGTDAQRAAMAGYGINIATAYGVGHGALKRIAKPYHPDHELALALWATGRHEARDLAGMIDDWRAVTPEQMEDWAAEFDSWDIVDGVCFNLFNRTPHADAKIRTWVSDGREFVRRAGFVLIACVALPSLKFPEAALRDYLALIEANAKDDRNLVRKGVSWALRTIGKRSLALHGPALAVAERLTASEDRAERWIGRDAVKELSGEKVRERLGKKA